MPLLSRLPVIAMCIVFGTAHQGIRAQKVTSADYARAERYLAPATVPLVLGDRVRPTWLADDRSDDPQFPRDLTHVKVIVQPSVLNRVPTNTDA